MSAIENLQQAIKAAAPGPFAMDAAFLTKGLNDSTVAVPSSYDTDIASAFQVKTIADFKVGVAAENVGAVTDNSFIVTAASIPFLGGSLASEATLVFGLSADGKTLVVQILSAPANWTWTNSFAFMNGFPFNQLAVSAAKFIFSTSTGTYPWTDTEGEAVEGGPKQNFFASSTFPAILQPFLSLFQGLAAPNGALDLSGVLDMSTYNGEDVLFPTGRLTAQLSNQSFELIYLNVTSPAVTLTLPAPSDGADDEGDQSPSLSINAGIGVDSGPSPYQLEVQIPFPGANSGEYSIGLIATGEGPLITPAAIAQLVPGGGSFLAATPGVLQQFLASVGLLGLTLSGEIGPPATVTAFGIQIGSSPNTKWTPIPFAPPGLNFTIYSFSLLWSLQYPFDTASRTQYFLFQTQFSLMPTIFKGTTAGTDGLFTVEFDSNLQFYAAFDGTVSLSDFLSTLTDGAVSLENTISATLSNVRLKVDGTTLGFTFSSGFSISLDFLKVGDKPILSISDGQISVSAVTPPATPPSASKQLTSGSTINTLATTGSSTAWTGSIEGALSVGPLTANVKLAYNGALDPPRWNLSAALAQPITVQQLMNQFWETIGYDFPNFLPGTLMVSTFAVTAEIPSGKGNLASSYNISTTFSWTFDLGGQKVGINPASIQLAYDGNKLTGQQFSGAASGTWIYDAIRFQLTMGYKFEQTAKGTNQTLYVDWEGFRATYDTGNQLLTFSLKGWTLGSLIQALVRTLGDPYFVLGTPWDLLNSISLDGLSVQVSLDSTVTNRVQASYELSKPLDLGFIRINKLIFRRDTTGKVTLAIDGSTAPFLQSSFGDLLNPAKGQDVQQMPAVPGRGNDYFKVFLLVMGQRIGITGYNTFKDTSAVIQALEKVPSTTGKLNPVNPNGDKGNPADGIPYYNRDNNWIIAAHLGLLQVAGVWTVDAMLVFNDPNLYGLRLALAGPKAGGLAGLSIDIIYKKITDDIGLFQIEFTFPDSIRNINLGAVSITLPQIGIQVYTNGDFLIDIGFPYNLDFRRSFSFYAIVYGVPVMGSGGFYFGKLSSATSTSVPVTTNGTFDPVIVFGIGLQIGLGYNFTMGPLSAGFALTVFGIIEGVIAAWHPYDASKALPSSALSSSTAALQSDYYFKLKGTVGIIGLLYGKLDFAIIQAAVNVKFTVSLQITYESYRQIPIIATVTLDISVSVKIDLGIFSFSISFSFSATLTAKFLIGSNETAPWDDGKTLAAGAHLRRLSARYRNPDAIVRSARLLQFRPRRVAVATPDTLQLMAAPQFTVLAPEGATTPSAQQGAFVFLMAMDAPASGPGDGSTSFEKLCAAYFPWIIDAMSQAQGDIVDLAAAAATSVTRESLEDYIVKLADNENSDLTVKALLQFLASAFVLNIATPSTNSNIKAQALDKGSVIFPVFDGLNLTVPAVSGSGTSNVVFETYTTASSGYRTTVSNLFAQVEANLDAMNQQNSQRLKTALDDGESMAGLVFTDSFALIGRQLMQAAVDALDNYAYPLQSNDSIQSIMQWALDAGNTLTPADIGICNQDHLLSASLSLAIPSLVYTQQGSDKLSTIASAFTDPQSPKRWQMSEESLILANGMSRCLQPGVPVILQGADGDVPYVTIPGDFFQNIADTIGVPLSGLATQKILYDLPGLLSAGGFLTIPAFAYKTPDTTPADSLHSVAALFATSVPVLSDTNLAVGGLFSVADQSGLLTLPKLDALPVSTLWTAIQATGQVAQTASMLSRFLMYGLRLPNAAGLTLSSDFLYSNSQNAYAMCQLTGQQFPTPAAAPSGGYSVTIGRAASSHDVDLSFVQFNGVAGTSASFALDQAYGLLSVVLTWAQSGAFQPSPTYAALPLATLTPRAFAVEQFALWSTSNFAALAQLTSRVATVASSSAAVQALLFALPGALLQQIQTRQNTLQSLGSFAETVARMPHYKPQVGSTSPATNQTEYSDLSNWTWATRIDFQIKRIPTTGVVKPPSDANVATVPTTTDAAPTLPNAYEVIGTSSANVLLLDQLLTAMDAMGEAIAPGLFLAYAQSSPSGQTLSTFGDDQFLAFLAQTNLSTETNPVLDARRMARAALSTMPRGIANSPHEFLRLLWELSVVRSGGYYLYYQTVDGGEGLPASLFDSTGTATVSAVVGYAASGDSSFGNAVLNFVNAVLTTDSVDTSRDILRVLSMPALAASNALTGEKTETLRSVSALYGVEPGSLVAANPTLALASVTLPVTGIWRQLNEADLADPSKTLDNLAAYYSAGAVTAITAADIQSTNPGVNVALASVFAIPAIQYAIQASSAPGNTFASIVAYYALSSDALAALCLDVSGLFVAGSKPQLNTESFDLNPAVGPGNIAIQLTRENLGAPDKLPDNPTQQQKDAYAKAFMYQLYQTLSAGLATNPYFQPGSPFGLPFGPQKPQDSASQPSAFASHAQRLMHRQARLAATANEPFDYRQTLGIARFAQSNAAPANPAAGLPPQSANPYIGVGTVAQVSLRWQDIFGNTTVTPFEQPSSSYTGALNGAANLILYNDLLLTPSTWPNVQLSYTYTGDSSKPVLKIDFKLDTAKYTDPNDQARRDLEQFTLAYFQLHQDYKDLKVPGVTGNAVSISLQNSLLANPTQPLTEDDSSKIRGFISGCVQWLSHFLDKTPVVAVPSATLNLTIDTTQIAAGNILALELNLVFTRQSALVQDTVAALDNGLSIAAPILPKPNPVGSEQTAYTEFATDFETVFQTTDWYFQVGEGIAQNGGAAPSQSEQLFAVRFGKAEGKGIYFELGSAPSYYAPKPVAKALESKTVTIVDYKSGNSVVSSFTAVDLNLWFQNCLDAVDTFFSPQYATPAFILDKALGFDPLKDGYFGKVLTAKQSLADDISSVVVPILSTSATDASSLWTASNAMRQRLLIALGDAYAAGAVVVYDVARTADSASAYSDNLYGQPSASLPKNNDSSNQNFSLSSARFPLTPVSTDKQGTPVTYDPRLGFVFNSKNVTEQSYVPLDLGLNLTHLEFDRTTVPGIDGYIQSRWLAFINGPFNYSLGSATVNVPVVDRALPTPPTMQRQQGVRHSDAPATPAALPLWDYSFDYLYQAVAQDTIKVTIEINDATGIFKSAAAVDGPDLFTALAQFNSAWPDISADMAAYLPLIGVDEPSPDVLAAAKKAVSTFEEYVTQVATAYHATIAPSATRKLAALPEKIEVGFETSMQSVDGLAQVAILNLTINRAAATWDANAKTITAGGLTLPAVGILIEDDLYESVAVNPPPANVTIAYQYKNRTDGSYLTWDIANSIPGRTVIMSGLNVLAHQNAWSTLLVERNKYLFPLADIGTVQTASDFLFQTPSVKFADLIVPQLVYAAFSLGALPGGGKVTLEGLLDDFFAGLFTGGNGQISIEAAFSGGYSYELMAGAPRVFLPVSYLPPASATVDPATPPAFCAVVAASIDDWRAAQKPTLTGNPQIDFILSLFGGLGEQQPLLIINDLYSKVS